MPRPFPKLRGVQRVAAACGLLVAASIASGQSADPKAAPRAFPGLPGAVDRPPAWLKPGAPFDAAKFLASPTAARNAAPLYLDALLEFSPIAAGCLPDDPSVQARVKAAQEREKRVNALGDFLEKGQPKAQVAAVDAVVAEHAAGIKKLAEAQKRPECVFATGLSLSTLLPHVQAARQVSRVYALKTARDLARGKIDDAIGNVSACLRLSRDLRPRGPSMSHLVSVAMDSVTIRDMIVPILGTRGLKIEQCDKLLKLLADRDSDPIDPFVEAVKYGSLSTLATIHEFTEPAEKLQKEYGVLPDTKAGDLLVTLIGADKTAADADLNGLLKDWKPADEVKATEFLYKSCKAQLEAASKPYADRLRASRPPSDAALPAEPGLKRLLQVLHAVDDPFVIATTRGLAEMRAAQALVLLRRWKLSKNAPPRDVDELAKAAKLASGPIDPFDGKPIRLATVGGETFVYSIGKDLKDEGGRVDSDRDRKAGDMLLKLPAPAPR